MLEGGCRLAVDGHPDITLEAGDFVLLPATPGFTMSGFEPVTPELIDPKVTSAPTDEVRHGTPDGEPDVRLLGGYFVFDSPDAALLASLLPAVVHVRGAERLSILVRLVGEESSEQRSGRDLVLTRLVEVLLIEALRTKPAEDAPPGLLRGLADARLAPAIRQMHGQVARSWTVTQLAQTAALSRSAFFERFTRTVGLPPMEYLLAWRMALAKDLLRRQGSSPSPRSLNASATARRAPSAQRSAGTSASPRVATRARPSEPARTNGGEPARRSARASRNRMIALRPVRLTILERLNLVQPHPRRLEEHAAGSSRFDARRWYDELSPALSGWTTGTRIWRCPSKPAGPPGRPMASLFDMATTTTTGVEGTGLAGSQSMKRRTTGRSGMVLSGIPQAANREKPLRTCTSVWFSHRVDLRGDAVGEGLGLGQERVVA